MSFVLRHFDELFYHRFNSSNASITSSKVITSPSTPIPCYLARANAKLPAHRTRPAQSAPEKPAVQRSAAKSFIWVCPVGTERSVALIFDRNDALLDVRVPLLTGEGPSMALHNGVLNLPLRLNASKWICNISRRPSLEKRNNERIRMQDPPMLCKAQMNVTLISCSHHGGDPYLPIWKRYLNLHLQSSRSKQCIIQQFSSIRHSNHKYIGQSIDSIKLC